MKLKHIFFAIPLLLSSTAFSANDHRERLLQSVPQPNSKLTTSDFPGGETRHSQPDETAHLRELVNLQAQQIKLLESRIKELERKK